MHKVRCKVQHVKHLIVLREFYSKHINNKQPLGFNTYWFNYWSSTTMFIENNKELSIPEVAKILEVDNTYAYRLVREERLQPVRTYTFYYPKEGMFSLALVESQAQIISYNPEVRTFFGTCTFR